jgi:hypothetical protein
VTRQALLVLGMHRSGTSALAGLLVRLGAAAPKTLMGASESNARGHWESEAFCALNDRLLAAAGATWSDPRRIDPAFFGPAARRFGAEFAKLVAQEFGRAPLVCIKDPRICRLLPFWLPQLAACDVAPRIVFVLRHPLEVALSLKARNGFAIGRSLDLWLRYNLDAELHTRHLPRAFVRYEDLLDDWRSQARRIARRFALRWPSPARTAGASIDAFLSVELRHHAVRGLGHESGAARAQRVNRTYAALGALARRRTRASLSALDEAKDRFDRELALPVWRPG